LNGRAIVTGKLNALKKLIAIASAPILEVMIFGSLASSALVGVLLTGSEDVAA
jgi:hypothetical protein